ncbi:ankyrin repeat domain-containing protein [Candidatus Berkiella aquae]|uniref:Ankyrin repeat domain-containing protein n=1 Tax=Candidatus Berkiella aquae TaxID=295108 RepID=A0A0Q9Z085_9GAMM|nr:ankyrin repeat domain-containing protein [Candidatus Berkiella aquae]MCS5711945.1 ankyrin repeat domain-containing protein [Candidatus Berkiella aquae]
MSKPAIPHYEINSIVQKKQEKGQQFFSAIESGNSVEVKRLYKECRFIEANKISGNKAKISPLLLATLCQHTSIVKFLVEETDWGTCSWNEDNESPLSEAIKSGNSEIVKILVNPLFKSHYFLQCLKDKNGNTPLHYVGQLTDPKIRKEIATILIEAGMYIYFENNEGKKPEHFEEMLVIERDCQNRFSNKIRKNFLLSFENLTPRKLGLIVLAIIGIGFSPLLISSPIVVFSLCGLLISYFIASALCNDHSETIKINQIKEDFEYMLKHGLVNQAKLTKYQSLVPVEHRISTNHSLELAVCSENINEIRLFMNAGASVNPSMIDTAITKGNFQLFCFLIDKTLKASGRTVITEDHIKEIIVCNRVRMLEYLLKKGIELPATVDTHPTSVIYKIWRTQPQKKERVSLLEFAKRFSQNKKIIQLIEKELAKKKPPTKVVAPLFEGKRQNVHQVSTKKVIPEKVPVRKQLHTASKYNKVMH